MENDTYNPLLEDFWAADDDLANDDDDYDDNDGDDGDDDDDGGDDDDVGAGYDGDDGDDIALMILDVYLGSEDIFPPQSRGRLS